MFIKVVKLGSFTAAATALELPRANVSRRIKELEDSLQTALFHRTTRKLSLTNQGESYYHDLVAAIEALDAANHSLIHYSGEVKGKVKIGVIAETHDVIQPAIFAFLEKYPEVEIDLRIITNGFVELHSQGLDIAFHGGKLINSDIVARKAFKLDRCLVASPSYINKFEHPKSIDDLSNHHAVCFRWGTGELDQHWNFANASITVNSKLVSSSIDFLKTAVIAGKGIGFCPKVLVNNEIESGKLIQLLPQETPLEEYCYLLYNPIKTLNSTTKILIDFLLNNIP